MDIKSRLFSDRNLHLAFRISLIVKALDALIEMAGGVAAYFTTRHFLVGVVKSIVQGELSEDPRDFVANYLLHSAQHFSISAQHFTSLYLLSHGAVKLWLVVGLLRSKLWYYPTAIIVFTAFVAYQLYRFTFTHSPWLLLLTVVDVVVIVLSWHEYKYLRRVLRQH